MSTAVADPSVASPAAPAAGAASTPTTAAGSPAGAAAAGSGAGAAAVAPAQTAKPAVQDLTPPVAAPAAAVAKVEPAKPADAKPADGAAVAAKKSLLADDAKPADAKPADAKPADAAAQAWSLEVPKDGPLSADDVKAVETFAKAEGLSKAQAEKVLARDVAAKQAVTAQHQQVLEKAHDQLAELATKELGAELQPTISAAKRFLTAAVKSEDRKALAESPFGNHPVVLRILAAAERFLPREDTVHANHGGDGPIQTNPAHDIYGKRDKTAKA